MDKEDIAIWVTITAGILSIIADAASIARKARFIPACAGFWAEAPPPSSLVHYTMTHTVKVLLACFCVLALVRAVRRLK